MTLVFEPMYFLISCSPEMSWIVSDAMAMASLNGAPGLPDQILAFRMTKSASGPFEQADNSIRRAEQSKNLMEFSF